MTCPERVATALATLPWVEPDTIKASRTARQARFTITSKVAFDADALRAAISRAGYPRSRMLKGPTEPEEKR